MGFDVSVVFCDSPVSPQHLSGALKKEDGAVVYLVTGAPCPLSGAQYFFSVWSNCEVSLTQLLDRLQFSFRRLFAVWKVEHAAVSGFHAYEAGGQFSRQVEGEGFLEFPAEAFLSFFGRAPQVESTSQFPEVVLDVPTACYRLHCSAAAWESTSVPVETVVALVEDDLEVEQVFP